MLEMSVAILLRNTFNKIMKQDLKWYPHQIFTHRDLRNRDNEALPVQSTAFESM